MISWETNYKIYEKNPKNQFELDSFLESEFPQTAKLSKSRSARSFLETCQNLRQEISPKSKKETFEVELMVVSSDNYSDYSCALLPNKSVLLCVPGKEPEQVSFDKIGRIYVNEFVSRHEMTHAVISYYGVPVSMNSEEEICNLNAYTKICSADPALHELAINIAPKLKNASFHKGKTASKVRDVVYEVNKILNDLKKSVAIVALARQYSSDTEGVFKRTASQKIEKGRETIEKLKNGALDIYACI